MRLWMVFLALLPACGFHAPEIGDGGNGGENVPPDAQACFGSFDLDKICFSVVPSMPVAIVDDMPINTEDTAACNPNVTGANKDKYCVIAGAGFTLAAGKTIRAFGTKPLVLLSTTNVDLQGGVDVSSHNTGAMNLGAGANPALACVNPLVATGNSGGFGGSFGGKGGDGEGVDGSRGIAMSAAAFPPVLRGGCPGGNGVSTNVAATPGVGGGGGGAVAIIATTSITFNNAINASGAGGLGGSANRSGGGGGGSGGMIILDAPSITQGGAGLVYANGGGGAEGGAGANGGTAAAGSPGGESMGPTMPAPKGGGSIGDHDGGNGGDGSSGTITGGVNAAGQSQSDGGGGAGGGGAGFVYAPGIPAAIVAPPSKNPPQT
jgi:hypothetical protein